MEMRADLIAPCGINCRLCMVYQRAKNPCPGCANQGEGKPGHCQGCIVTTCGTRPALAGGCAGCAKRCNRMKYLDSSYRKKYGMSPLGNLRAIRDGGMEAFLLEEQARWECPSCGDVLCVHEQACPSCGVPRDETNRNGGMGT